MPCCWISPCWCRLLCAHEGSLLPWSLPNVTLKLAHGQGKLGSVQVSSRFGDGEGSMRSWCVSRHGKMLPGCASPWDALHWTMLGRGGLYPQAGVGKGEEVLLQTICFSFSPISPQKITKIGDYWHCIEMCYIPTGTPASVLHLPFCTYVRLHAHIFTRRDFQFICHFCLWSEEKIAMLWWRKRGFGVERGS